LLHWKFCNWLIKEISKEYNKPNEKRIIYNDLINLNASVCFSNFIYFFLLGYMDYALKIIEFRDN